MSTRLSITGLVTATFLCIAPGATALAAQEDLAAVSAPGGAQPTVDDLAFVIHNVWMLLSTALVFIMHLGFATVESGLTRAKNTCNILFKNTLIPAIGLLTYAAVGFNLMYPGDSALYGLIGTAGVGIASGPDGMTPAYNAGYTYWTDFLFQGMFAATAATIVSGAVAERVRLLPFLIFSTFFVGFSYPVTGYWKWGGGWLDGLDVPFYDFAGSTLVHSVGGWGALMGAIVLGPRLGKYGADGAANAIPGHNMPLATIGVFLLWLGWFGFNGGSVLSADPGGISLVLVTTCLAGAAGAVGAAVASAIIGGKPDLSMALNGILAGLVGITAGADVMNAGSATIVGMVSGVVVVCSVIGFERVRVDDPVGAISVHLVCGIWGTLAVGLFGAKAGWQQLVAQVVGILSVGMFTVLFAGALLLILKKTMGLRVSAAEEIEGLDLGEHEMAAYPDFQHTYIKSYHVREI